MSLTRRETLSVFAAANMPQPDRPRALRHPGKVTGIEVTLLQKELKERFWMANSPIGGFRPRASRVIVTLHTDAGIDGHGEGGGGGADMFRKGFGDLVLGEDPFMVGKIWEKMFTTTHSRVLPQRGWSQGGVLSAMAAVDAALYDVMSKSAGLPLFKFLGGYRNTVPVYVTGGYYREGKGIPELVSEIRGYVDQGFNAIKLKIGGVTGGYTPEDDYKRVKAVRDAVGPQVKLMLDVNNGWDVATTIHGANLMEPLGITWLEEPLYWYDEVEALKRVKMNIRIPLASGEHEITRWGARRLIETNAIDVLQFDCHAHAGITEWRKIAGMASMCHVQMAPHHEPQVHGHLLASVPNALILESFSNPGRDPFWFEIYDRKPKIEKSVLYLDDTPGLGVEFNRQALARYGTKVV